MPENKIKIYGELVAQTEEGIVANTSSIYSVPDSKYLNEVLEGLEDKTDIYIVEATVDEEHASADGSTLPLIISNDAEELYTKLTTTSELAKTTFIIHIDYEDGSNGIYNVATVGDGSLVSSFRIVYEEQSLKVIYTYTAQIEVSEESGSYSVNGTLNIEQVFGNSQFVVSVDYDQEHEAYVIDKTYDDFMQAIYGLNANTPLAITAMDNDGGCFNLESWNQSGFVFSSVEPIDNEKFTKKVLVISWSEDPQHQDEYIYTVTKKTYTIGGNVEANPQDAATATLSKLKVNGTTYAITDTQPIYYNINGTIIYDANTDTFSLTVSNTAQELYEKLAAVYLDKTLQVQGNFNLATIASGESTPSVTNNYCLTLKMNNIIYSTDEYRNVYDISFETTSLGVTSLSQLLLKFDFCYLIQIGVIHSNNSGEYSISPDIYTYGATNTIADTPLAIAFRPVTSGAVYDALQGKQNTLVSGTNIKTIDNQSILGEGNITTSAIQVVDSTTLLPKNDIPYYDASTATTEANILTFITNNWGVQNPSISSKLFAYEYDSVRALYILKYCTIAQVTESNVTSYYFDINAMSDISGITYLFLDSDSMAKLVAVEAADLGDFFEVSTFIKIGTGINDAYSGAAGVTDASNISTLQGYFTGGIANNAANASKDGDGNNIVNTYATKIELGGKENTLAISGSGLEITRSGNTTYLSLTATGVTTDSTLSPTSENPVQNKAIYNAVENLDLTKQDIIDGNNKLSVGYVSGLANVATSGSYNDLTDKPNIPEGAIVDTSFDSSSNHAIANSTVTNKFTQVDTAIAGKQATIDSSHKLSASLVDGLNSIATSGLPIASASTLGGIKIGQNLQIAADGTLDALLEGEGLTKAIADTYYVPLTRTIAGNALSSDINASTLKSSLSLSASDVGLGNVTNVSTTSSVTEGSTSNVTSGAVFTALQGKQNTLIAGQGVHIDGNTISLDNGVYDVRVVATLPLTGESGVIYIDTSETLPTGGYQKYVWEANQWQLIGTTVIDLDNYVPTSRTIAGIGLDSNITNSDLKTALNLNNVTNVATTSTITSGSNQNITSGAVYNALQSKQDKITSASLDDQTIVKAIGFTAGGVLAKGVASPTNYLVSASVSGDTLTINPSSGSNVVFTPSFTDNNQTVKSGAVTFGANDVVDIKAQDGITATGNATNKEIVIAPDFDTDANVVSMVDDIFMSYTITTSVTNGTYSGASSIQKLKTATVTIAASSGYELPSAITVSGASFTYDSTTGAVVLSNATGNVTISASCPAAGPTTYSGDITRYESYQAGGRTTTLKFDTAPTSASDYDTYIYASTMTGATSYSGKTKVYVWGNRMEVKINNVVVVSGTYTYSNAVEVNLTGNYNIEVAYYNDI